MCEHVDLGGGNYAIICGGRQRRKFCACGREADLLCDWKVKEKKSGMCDQPICRQHALEVGPEKHLCQAHQKAYADWKKRHPEQLPREPVQAGLFEEKAATA